MAILIGVTGPRASTAVGESINHGRHSENVGKLLALALTFYLTQQLKLKMDTYNGRLIKTTSNQLSPKTPDPFKGSSSVRKKFIQLVTDAFKVNLFVVVDVSKLKLKDVKLSEQDIQGICDELLTYLQAQAPIDTRIAAIFNDQQSEGELLKTVTKKIENWYTQSGGGGCRGLFNARKEELLATTATTPAL